jgi:hypothetical protein
MKCRIGALAVLIVALGATNASADPVKVHLRIEGATKTLFEGNVKTDGHTIKGHTCDGTNGGVNPSAVPTFTGALDDAATGNKFKWSGSWNDQFSDYLVETIGGETPAQPNFWGSYLNFGFAQLGGCQQKVEAGDDVTWAVASGSEKYYLKLTGPKKAVVGKAFTLKVVDGATGKPVTGATLRKVKVPANGKLKVKAAKPGKLLFKAEAPDAIRSNGVLVTVKKATK